jgi:hypothetical protein
MRIRIVFLILGTFFAGGAPVAAQSSAPHGSLAQAAHSNLQAPRWTASPWRDRVFPYSAFQFRSGLQLGRFPALAGRYRNNGVSLLPLPDQVTTLFASQSIIPVATFGKGRLSFAGFSATLHFGNVVLGPSGAGGLLDFRPPRHYQPADPRPMDSYGLSLKLHLGRPVDLGHRAEFWRGVSRLLSDIQ